MANTMMGQAVSNEVTARAAPTPETGMGQRQDARAQQQGLDTAETAGQPQTGDADTATFETMVAGLRDHVFGKGEKGIVERLTEVKDDPNELVKRVGEVCFILVQEAAHQAEQAGREIDMDILMGVATELLDDLSDLMEAYGIEITDQQKHDALLMADQLYVESANPSDDERNAAKQTLAAQKEDGDVNKAVAYVQKRGTEAGTDPFGVADMKGGAKIMGTERAEEGPVETEVENEEG